MHSISADRYVTVRLFFRGVARASVNVERCVMHTLSAAITHDSSLMANIVHSFVSEDSPLRVSLASRRDHALRGAMTLGMVCFGGGQHARAARFE